MEDDTTRDGWLGSAAIPGEWLETPRPGMLYTMLQRRERGQLVLRLMESTNAEGPDIDHLERALAVIVVQKGALPRVLDALESAGWRKGRMKGKPSSQPPKAPPPKPAPRPPGPDNTITSDSGPGETRT